MTNAYDPKTIEPKWQQRWEEEGLYEADLESKDEDWNNYNLTMYPYPSGHLHVGHAYAYTGPDVYGRYMRAQGHNVFFPFGYDSFGLPAENAAIRNNSHPRKWTDSNVAYMTEQIKRLGMMIDWRSMLATHKPEYYKWNQWFFLKFFERGLAYRKQAPVDWCPSCNTSLAREQVIGDERLCERCDTPVVKRDLEQWLLKITDYAEDLLQGLDEIDWPERIKTMQRNWIGKSEGAYIVFESDDGDEMPVFTTRPDTVYGATFMVLAPEHPLVAKLTTDERRGDVETYVEQARRKTEIERLATDKEKSGVFMGAHALNPLSEEHIPIFVGDYVLMSYGTGAIMGVPAHDQRDFDFAKKHDLPIPVVIAPPGWDGGALAEAYTGPGPMVNSGRFNGVFSLGKYFATEWNQLSESEKQAFAEEHGYPVAEIEEALKASEAEGKTAVTEYMEQTDTGGHGVSYRLRDWLISRQRYWGTPIPIVYCAECGTVPVPEEDLPVELPTDVDFRPTGESPLHFHERFRNTTCPACGGPAERETDTMDTFVDSSWYQYRYLSPHFDEGPFDIEAAESWVPVDQYMGGAEHAVMHLLYSRFWTKVMRDMGLVDFDEPFLRLFNQGTILGPDGQKMSKSRGNVVSIDYLFEKYSADVIRGYLMFIGPWEKGGPLSLDGIEGVARFYNRVWDLMVEAQDVQGEPDEDEVASLETSLHQTIQRAQDSYESFSFNTALAALMEFSNTLRSVRNTPVVNAPIWEEALDAFLLMLAPLAPHLAEEIWEQRGKPFSIHQQPWPEFDPEKAKEDTFELVLQHNGKVRATIEVPAGISEEEAKALALEHERIRDSLDGGEPERMIYVPGRLVNVVG